MAALTIWTWNVRYFSQGLGGLAATWPTLRGIADVVAAADPLPDVLALQEVETRSLRGGMHRAPQLSRFLSALRAGLARRGRSPTVRGIYFPAHVYGPASLPLYTTGLALVVRGTVVVERTNAEAPADVTHVRLSAFGAWKQRRVVGHVRVRPAAGGPGIDVYVTHLSLPAFLEVGPHRVPEAMGEGSNQLREIENVLRTVGRNRDDAAILAGDFNAAPGSPAHRAIIDAGWRDPTPEHARAVPTAAFLDRRMHIDHLFGTPAVVWSRVTVGSIDAAPFAGRSDHAPKMGTFDLG